jgi:hypothetical protein
MSFHAHIISNNLLFCHAMSFSQVFHSQLFCSILKKTLNMAYQTPQDLDLYLVIEKKEMKSIDVEYQVQNGY